MVAGRPSYGHMALATLMRAQLARIVWTTNFDSLIADACAKVYDSTGALTVVALDAPDIATQVITEGRWPVEIKLHGDFRSRRLKNTNDELQHQDARLRNVLVDSCKRFGLVVVGYSGRDDSIMSALDEALKSDGAFPAGLFWLHRGEDPPMPRVVQLLTRAAERGAEAALVLVENFDEALRDLMRPMSGIDTRILDSFASERNRWSSAPPPSGRKGWPVVRLNALHLVHTPGVCRRVVCNIGGYSEIREAIQQAGVEVLGARTGSGVLCYGTDADVRSAFGAHGITDFDLHTIDPRRLRRECGERGLLRDALTRAIMRQRGLNGVHRRTSNLLAPTNPQDASWAPLSALVGTLSGAVADHDGLRWKEGIGIRLDWADDRLWLLIEPRTVFAGITANNRAIAADFARERVVRRYNRQLNNLIAFWARLLVGDGSDLCALGIVNGVDAAFRFSANTGYSRRAKT